jgi:hypothetical protein
MEKQSGKFICHQSNIGPTLKREERWSIITVLHPPSRINKIFNYYCSATYVSAILIKKINILFTTILSGSTMRMYSICRLFGIIHEMKHVLFILLVSFYVISAQVPNGGTGSSPHPASSSQPPNNGGGTTWYASTTTTTTSGTYNSTMTVACGKGNV